jgi:hypothetical protein
MPIDHGQPAIYRSSVGLGMINALIAINSRIVGNPELIHHRRFGWKVGLCILENSVMLKTLHGAHTE